VDLPPSCLQHEIILPGTGTLSPLRCFLQVTINFVIQRLRMAKCPPIISPKCREVKRSARPKGLDTELYGTDTQALPPVLRAFGWRAVLSTEPPCVCCLTVWAPLSSYLVTRFSVSLIVGDNFLLFFRLFDSVTVGNHQCIIITERTNGADAVKVLNLT
jgi:hypothetical protein